jgi:hypothetical protein
MNFRVILLLCAFASSGFSQTKAVTFTVITDASAAHSPAPEHIRAVLPMEDTSAHINSRKIRFYPGGSKFVFRNAEGLLTWFSYTSPPKNKKRVYIEADQTSFGALLYRNTLYVCTPDQPQQSLPVINALLASVHADSLNELEAQSVALLMAKCSDTLQVYGDPQSTSEAAQKQMQKVASPPITAAVNGDTKVEFYSWSTLPNGAISRWSFLFRANRLLTVDRVEVSPAAQ